MNFLSITGPKADIDRVVNTYLCKYEIHLENALSELTTVESLTPFLDVNPYRDALNSINTIYEELKTPPSTSNRSPGIETALSTVRRSAPRRISSRRNSPNWKKNVPLWKNHCGSYVPSEILIMIFHPYFI